MSFRTNGGVACVVGLALGLGVAGTAQDLPAGVKALTPSQLTYRRKIARAPGVLTAPLFGVPSKAEYYVFRAKYPPETRSTRPIIIRATRS